MILVFKCNFFWIAVLCRWLFRLGNFMVILFIEVFSNLLGLGAGPSIMQERGSLMSVSAVLSQPSFSLNSYFSTLAWLIHSTCHDINKTWFVCLYMTKFEIYIREQSIAYREKVLKKSHPVLRNLSSKTLFFTRFFENVDYRTNSPIEVPCLPTENCS